MLLHELLRDFQLASESVPNVTVSGIGEDSRLIQPGDLFIARRGTVNDGARFLREARQRGAVAAVTEAFIADSPLPQVVLPTAAAASLLSHRFFSDPSRRLKVLAVTGTNGKTTTTYLLRHVLNKLNRRCGMIGTVEVDDGSESREATMTTPGAIEVARLLAAMRDHQCQAAAIETSSHALHQQRVAGVHFAGAAFMNLTGDHLDYHKLMEKYAAAKAMLFEMLDETAVAAANGDDPWCGRMIQNCRARIVRFGFSEGVDYRAADIAITAGGTKFILHAPDGRWEMNLQLIGRYNIQNTLAAVALLCEVFGFGIHQVAAALKDAAGAPGRLQSVKAGQPFAVLVDYAHTDDALENVLSALRPLTRRKLRVVFGCGGDRDRTKRPRMAAVAQRLADEIYITSDNPRTENPQAILDEIFAGLLAETASVHVQIDRRRAIEQALNDSAAGDVVLIAGKGHENYQTIGSTNHHFDDVEECGRILAMVANRSAS